MRREGDLALVWTGEAGKQDITSLKPTDVFDAAQCGLARESNDGDDSGECVGGNDSAGVCKQKVLLVMNYPIRCTFGINDGHPVGSENWFQGGGLA